MPDDNKENQGSNKPSPRRLEPLNPEGKKEQIAARNSRDPLKGPPVSALQPQNDAQEVIPNGTVKDKVSKLNKRSNPLTDGTNTQDKTSQSDPTTEIPETTKQNSTQFDSTSFVNAAFNQAALKVATNRKKIAEELAENNVESIMSDAITQASQRIIEAEQEAANQEATNIIQEVGQSEDGPDSEAVESVVNPTNKPLDLDDIELGGPYNRQEAIVLERITEETNEEIEAENEIDNPTLTTEEKTSLSDLLKQMGEKLNSFASGIGQRFTGLSNKIRGSENIKFSNITTEVDNAVNETKEDLNKNKDITTDQKNKITDALDKLKSYIPTMPSKKSNRDKIFGKMLEGFKNFLFPTQQQEQQTLTAGHMPQEEVQAKLNVRKSGNPNPETIVKDPGKNNTSLNKDPKKIMKQVRGQMNEIPTQVDPKLFDPNNNTHTNTQRQAQTQQQFQSQQQPRSLQGLPHNVDNLNLTPFTNNQNPQQQYAPRNPELDDIYRKLDRMADKLDRTQAQQQPVPQQEKSEMSNGMKAGLAACLLLLFLINPGLVALAVVGAASCYAGYGIMGKIDEYRDNRKNKENNNQVVEQQQVLSRTPNQSQNLTPTPTPPTTPNLNTGQNVGRGGK